MALSLYYDTFPANHNPESAVDLVLLHGWGMSSLVWDEIMPELLEHFRVTVIDLPGFGRSPIPGGDYDLDYLSKHVLNVAPKQAVWMGWSLGGMVAMSIAGSHPERVKGLISVTGTPSFITRDGWPYGMPAEEMEGFSTLVKEDSDGSLIRFLALQAKGSEKQREDIRKLKEMVYFHGIPAPQALRGGMDILCTADIRAMLPDIRCSCLFIYGENDQIVAANTAEGVRALMPGATISTMKGLSHIPFITDPDAFLKEIQEFLCEYRPRSE
ncbi:MAG: pimeloyl-ACP methyl ester esterase BioH [Gammaproteobacteria bacterium]|nr:pimeloyl-ACP methyl ester esterase BioH [Gammaproteobacteria bacterium]